MSSVVSYEKRGAAFWIFINRPERRNALTPAVIEGLTEGFRQAEEDAEIRVTVLTGAGDFFCSGMDLKETMPVDFSRDRNPYSKLIRYAKEASKPSIARINGACMAGGMGLLAMTDLAVAVDSAVFGLPEVKIGLFPMQVVSLMQSLAPPRRLAQWCYTGEKFDARTAFDAGLLNFIASAEEFDAKTNALIEQIAANSPTAIRRGKYALRTIASMSFEEALSYTESQIGTFMMTQDAKEGVAAFIQKRSPVFPGK